MSQANTMNLWQFKKVVFLANYKEMFNPLKFISGAKLHKSYVQGLQDEVTCKSHVNYLEPSAFTSRHSFNIANFSKVKYICQFVIRLKAIKYY